MMEVCDDFDMCDQDNTNKGKYIVSDGNNYYDIETGRQYYPEEHTNVADNLLNPPTNCFKKTIYYLKNPSIFFTNLWKSIITCSFLL